MSAASHDTNTGAGRRASLDSSRLVGALAVLALSVGCSVQRYAIDKLGDALAGSGTSFASDDDIELVRDAVPFSLKLIESVLAESPRHEGLLLAAASGFTQYANAFVQQDADMLQERDLDRSEEQRARANRLYRRARDYGLRGLDTRHAGLAAGLRRNPQQALKATTAADVPFLYWTASAWGLRIAGSKDDPEIVADQPIVEALIDRALALDEGFQDGAIHAFLIAYEGSRPQGHADWMSRARDHFERAIQESGGQMAAPYVSMAEAIAIQSQDRTLFESLLKRALAIDVDARPEARLSNLVTQRRARWLMARTEALFVE